MANDIPTPEEFTRTLLAKRGFAVAELEKARKSGKGDKIAEWESLIRETDDLLAEHGVMANA